MNSITTSFSSSSQNISYAALGVAAVALVSSLTSIALIIFTKIRLDAANKKMVPLSPSSETDDKKITDLNMRLAGLENKVTQLTQQISAREGLLGQHHQALNGLLEKTQGLGNHLTVIQRFSHLALTSIFPVSANNKNFHKLIHHYCNNTTKTPSPIPYMRITPTDPRRNIDNSTYRDVTILELQISTQEQEMHLVISHGFPIQKKVNINPTFAQIETILFEEPKT